MIGISDMSFFRFCWKNGKLDWPKCARTVSVSGEPAQKEQESVSFLPILRRKSFVATLLCRNLNWNTLNFVSVVHRKGRLIGIFPIHLYIWKKIFSKPLSLAFRWWGSLSFDQNLIKRFANFLGREQVVGGFFQGSEVLIAGTFYPEMFKGRHYFIVL